MQLFWLTFLHETIMIFIKALDTLNHPAKGKTVKISSTGMKGFSSPSTSTDGVVKFSMDPGEYRVYISGKYIVTQYLNETNNTFHIMWWCSVCIQKSPPVRGDFSYKKFDKKIISITISAHFLVRFGRRNLWLAFECLTETIVP